MARHAENLLSERSASYADTNSKAYTSTGTTQPVGKAIAKKDHRPTNRTSPNYYRYISESHRFSQLPKLVLQELRKEFNRENPPLSLAVAISGYKEVIDAAYELSEIGKVVDFMSVMSYDYHGSWERRTGHVSPLYERPGDMYPQYNTVSKFTKPKDLRVIN